MTQIERDTRRYLQHLYDPDGPSVEVVSVDNIEAILSFARSMGWIEEGDGHGLSEKGIREVIGNA
jgi:hypothetical protein